MMAIFDSYQWFGAMLLGSARITPIFFLLPFLKSSIISMTIRTPVIMMVGLSLWPYPASEMLFDEIDGLLLVIAREVFVGLIMAVLFALPFWIMHGIGSLIDNQRGATISSTLDPMTGVDTSELANLFNLFAGALFLAGGGLIVLLEALEKSYQLCEPLGTCTPEIMPTLGILTQLMGKILVLASPVVAALLLTEMLLGLLSRFAPQLNAFSISLTVKSGVAFFILILYFTPVIPDAFKNVWLYKDQLDMWFLNDQ